MKAVGYLESKTIEHADALMDIEIPMPEAIIAENLKRAHAHIETGKAVGKVVLAGF